MKKTLSFLLLLFLASPASAHAADKVKIVATLPVFAAIAQEVGGSAVEITSLARANQDPHFIDPKPSFVVSLSQADLLLHGGLELESGWLPPLVQQARNPKILSKGSVDLSRNIPILDVPQGKIDRSAGDIHPSGNPHVWMDPRNALIMAQTILKALSQERPDQASLFSRQEEDFESRLKAKISSWETTASGLKGKKVITYHKSFTYLTHWLGIETIENIEPKPGIPPSSSHIDGLVALSKTQPLFAILSENFYPSKMSKYLSEKTGRPFLTLETDTEKGQSYIDFMDRTVSILVKVTGP